MRILTLWQPYASLIKLGLKQWETRPHTINWDGYRGSTAIHAASQSTYRMTEQDWELLRSLHQQGCLPSMLTEQDIPYGAVLTIVEMADSQIMTPELIAAQSPLELQVGNWQVGRKAIALHQNTPLSEPIPFRGAQGLRNASPELCQLISQRIDRWLQHNEDHELKTR